jgi:hypothetical protein
LVDVRQPADLTGSHYPELSIFHLSEILHRRWRPVLQSHDYQVAFFSYSDTHAEEAWLITRRAGLKDLKVLEGGLNNFLYSIFLEESDEKARYDYPRFFRAAPAQRAKPVTQPQIPEVQVISIDGGC